VIAVSVSVVVLYGLRLQRGSTWSLRLAVRLSSLGYALPGMVIAVGVLIPLGRLDQLLSYLRQVLFQQPPGLVLSGTIAALVFGYLVRFLAVALATVEATLLRIPPSLDEAAPQLRAGIPGHPVASAPAADGRRDLGGNAAGVCGCHEGAASHDGAAAF
jgi:iron(III) transport system permease protein